PIEVRPVEVRPVEPAPIEVTRFQVALNVDTVPPPLADVEFKPTQLLRPRAEPRILSDPAPGEGGVDPASPALIVDRPSTPTEAAPPQPVPLAPMAPRPALLGPTPLEAVPLEATPPPAALPLRTPGSALVLPANPLQDLSDESLEGFVDCTLYEEEGSFFPTSDAALTEAAAASAAPPAPAPAPPAT